MFLEESGPFTSGVGPKMLASLAYSIDSRPFGAAVVQGNRRDGEQKSEARGARRADGHSVRGRAVGDQEKSVRAAEVSLNFN